MRFLQLLISLSLITSILHAEDKQQLLENNDGELHEYVAPTKKYVEAYGGRKKLIKALKNVRGDLKYLELFDTVSDNEKLGFSGYYVWGMSYRIYQDIIRLLIEEIVQIPVKEDFHFFAFPGDPKYNLEPIPEVFKHSILPNDYLRLSYSIYGSLYWYGEHCPYRLFYGTFDVQECYFTRILTQKFTDLGMDSSEIGALFEIGNETFQGDSGVILQIFDLSHEYGKRTYELADQYFNTQPHDFSNYVSQKLGVANTYKWMNYTAYHTMFLSNKGTLNPFSALSINRCDAYPKEVTKQYLERLREKVRTLDYSQEKAEAYRNLLLDLWAEK